MSLSVIIKVAALDLMSIFMLGAQSTAQPTHGFHSASNNSKALECAVNPTTISNNGYQLEIYLANTGSNVIKDWQVTLNFSEPAQVTGSWNASMSEVSTTTITASSVSWNRELLPGQSTSFGIQGIHDGIFGPPTCSAN